MREIAATRGIDLAASYAYSDSATDIPMLEAVGHPVAVNPDRELARVAAEREWEVRWFIHRVRLRDRVRMPAPGPTAAVGGGLAATAAAGCRRVVVAATFCGLGAHRRRATSGSDGADLLGRDGSERDQDEEDEQLLHVEHPTAGGARRLASPARDPPP